MSVRRIMGAETEYGIATSGRPDSDTSLAPAQAVNAHRPATAGPHRVRLRAAEPAAGARGFYLNLRPGLTHTHPEAGTAAGTRAHVGELMDRCSKAADLVRALTGWH